MKLLSIKISFLILFSIIIIAPLSAQSRYLENGIGGSCVSWEGVVDSTGLFDMGIAASYSIGGIMDIGFQLNREIGLIENYSKVDWNYAFLYNLIIIKQTKSVPFSFQLEGSYGFSNTDSDGLQNLHFTNSGQGFQIGGLVYREFKILSSWSLLLGVEGAYRNYLYTMMDETNPASPVIDSLNRIEDFQWGGLAAVTFRAEHWPVISLESGICYDQNSGRILVEPKISIISPSY